MESKSENLVLYQIFVIFICFFSLNMYKRLVILFVIKRNSFNVALKQVTYFKEKQGMPLNLSPYN